MYKKIIVFVLLFGMFSCDEYLDIVPDQTQQIDLLFERREVAYSALATCYAYLPKNDGVYTSFMMMSDEVTTPIAKETDGIRIMKGQQSSSNPKFGLWSGWQDQGSLWEGIRHCNVLIENIYNVVDMTEDEMDIWAAEAKFLKAYYHFLLFTYYGPVPIVDENLPIKLDVSAFFSSVIMKFEVPSAVLRAILPVNPSVIITFVSPFVMLFPSM